MCYNKGIETNPNQTGDGMMDMDRYARDILAESERERESLERWMSDGMPGAYGAFQDYDNWMWEDEALDEMGEYDDLEDAIVYRSNLKAKARRRGIEKTHCCVGCHKDIKKSMGRGRRYPVKKSAVKGKDRRMQRNLKMSQFIEDEVEDAE